MANKKKPRRRPSSGPPPQPAKRDTKASTGQAPASSGGAPSSKSKSRTARLEAARQEQRRRLRRRNLLVAALVAAVVGVGVTLVLVDRSNTEAEIAALEAEGCAYDTESDSLDRDHVADPSYVVDPPSGGPHADVPARPGLYRLASLPSDGQLVHALEHGDIVVWHPVDISVEDLTRLEDLAFKHDDDVLVVPRISLESGVAATAWGKRLVCPTLQVGSVEAFIEAFRDEGPENFD